MSQGADRAARRNSPWGAIGTYIPQPVKGILRITGALHRSASGVGGVLDAEQVEQGLLGGGEFHREGHDAVALAVLVPTHVGECLQDAGGLWACAWADPLAGWVPDRGHVSLGSSQLGSLPIGHEARRRKGGRCRGGAGWFASHDRCSRPVRRRQWSRASSRNERFSGGRTPATTRSKPEMTDFR